MSQAAAKTLIPKLRFKLHSRRNLRNPEGPKGRHEKIKKTVTALFKHERIEMNYSRADESRGYAERLISDAIKYGDTHKPTMEMASYWIIDPSVIHKLFKVLAPRYENYTISYTKLWRAPSVYPGNTFPKCVLELRNNIYPPLGRDKTHSKNLIHNVLLEEARKIYRQEKALKAQKNAEGEQSSDKIICENSSNVKENVEVNAAVEANVESTTCRKTYNENKLPNENLQAVCESENDATQKSEVNSEVEEDFNFSKMKITEEKLIDSSDENKNK